MCAVQMASLKYFFGAEGDLKETPVWRHVLMNTKAEAEAHCL